ncbi:MAG: hypothetical protein J6C78_05080 [Muribaculaceae bacterium]|nr:hypothetical protein [Muribaculaceae bacterium]
MNHNNDIKFIASRYRKGRFAVDPALRRLGITPRRWWTPVKIAAAAAIAVVMTATAAMIYHNYSIDRIPEAPQAATPAPSAQSLAIKVIDFEDTPLPQVVEKIKEVYGVTVTNIPSNADQYRLSLHYEGTAKDLTDTINDILGTDLKIDEQ